MGEMGMGDEAAAATVRAVTSVGAFAAAAARGPVGALAALVGKEAVDAAGMWLIKLWRDRRDERASQLLQEALNEYHSDLGTFTSTIEESPELLALLSAAVQAAMETPLESKIRALAGCVARGVEDEARVDAETLRVRGLARIDNPEVVLMSLISQTPAFIPADPEAGADGTQRYRGWRRVEILAALPGYELVLDAVVARLLSEGLAIDAGVGTWGGGGPGREQWALTAFGTDCLNLLQAVTEQPAGLGVDL